MAKYKRKKISIGVTDSVSPAKQIVWLVVLSILFFLTICFSANATIKTTAMVLMCLTLLGGIISFSTLRQRIHWPLIALFLVVLMGGISTSYALSGKFALQEFLKLLCALCSGLLLLMLTPGTGANPGRRIASVLEGSCALISLFSVDLISTRLLSTPLLLWLGSSAADYQGLTGVEPGIRMLSIFNHPNVFAGCVGIGVLLSLGLVLSSSCKKERSIHLCCLLINSVAFLLAFSMGATVSIAAAFLVFLIFEHKDKRSDLFILMMETLILSGIAAALSAAVAFDSWDGIQPIPLLSLVLGCALLCLADRFIGQSLAQKLRSLGKLLLITIVIIILLALLLAILACTVTGSIHLESGATLRRAVYPTPGSYTLSVQGNPDIEVAVESKNQQDTMMHTSTTLYHGTLSEATFTVPEDASVVFIYFAAHSSATLDSAQLVGMDGSISIPLNYTLLPSFIANRLQGIRANQNAIQRGVFFEDGMKLFQESPVIGFGLGAFENAVHRVQSFFYQTKYVHNHYIQTLLETGIIGTILFIGLLVISAVCILLTRKKEGFHPLTPALGSLLVFMAIHASIEVVFSTYPYLPLAFGAFMLINLCCGEDIFTRVLNKKACISILIVVAVLILIFAILLAGNMFAYRIANTLRSFTALDRALSMDKFEWTDHALSYVMSTLTSGLPDDVLSRASELAKELAKVSSNTIPLELTRYYFYHGDTAQAFAMAEQYATYLSASSSAWNNLFDVLRVNLQPGDAYMEGVSHIVTLMEEWDIAHIGSIELSLENELFINSVLGR